MKDLTHTLIPALGSSTNKTHCLLASLTATGSTPRTVWVRNGVRRGVIAKNNFVDAYNNPTDVKLMLLATSKEQPDEVTTTGLTFDNMLKSIASNQHYTLGGKAYSTKNKVFTSSTNDKYLCQLIVSNENGLETREWNVDVSYDTLVHTAKTGDHIQFTTVTKKTFTRTGDNTYTVSVESDQFNHNSSTPISFNEVFLLAQHGDLYKDGNTIRTIHHKHCEEDLSDSNKFKVFLALE